MAIYSNLKSKTEVADIVIVIGNDEGEETHHQTFFKEVRETCEKLGLKYTILGDGKSGFLEDEILLLPKTKHLAIQAHGEIKNGTHTIVLDDEINKKTLKFIKKLQDQTGSQNIILGSCFGGKVIEELENSKIRLLQNTFLFVGSAPDEFSLYHDNVLIHNILLKNIKKHGHRLNMPLLVRDVIKTIPQTLVLSYQPSPLEEADIPLQTLTLRRMDREIIFEIIKLCQYKLDAFNKFLGKILHGIYDPFFIDQLKMDYNIPDMSDKFNLINLEMNQEEINYYRTTSIINHVFHRDIKLINSLLKDHPFSSSLMYEIILSKYSNSEHMEHIMDILLANIHNAADNQSIDTFQQGFFIPEKDYTPLTLALEKNRIELAKLLIIHGANIYLPDKKGRTPIDIIKKNSQQTIFNQIFFDAKAIYDMIMLIESDSINKKYPKFKLILNAYNDFLKLCQKENCIDFLNNPFSLSTHKNLFSKFQHFIFLAHEIRNEIPVIAYLYMENIAQPDLKNQLLKKINHQFFSAIIKDNTRLVSNLMNAGFNINSTIHENETPLYIALNNKNYTMAKMLIKKGASVNCKSNTNETPLHLSITNDQFDITELLLKHGANINAINSEGETPLYQAVVSGNDKIVKLLLNYQADINIPNNAKQLPIYHAAALKNFKMLRLLSERGADLTNLVEDFPYIATIQSNIATMAPLIKRIQLTLNELCNENPIGKSDDINNLKILLKQIKEDIFQKVTINETNWLNKWKVVFNNIKLPSSISHASLFLENKNPVYHNDPQFPDVKSNATDLKK